MERHKSKGVMITFFFLFFLLSCNFAWFRNINAEPIETRIVNMSLYLGNFPNETMNELLDWLKGVNYKKWTLILEPWSNGTHSNAFFNSTFIDKLKQYGELTPALPFGIQNYLPEYRKEIVDNLLDYWQTYVGYEPKGFFQFQPDTYVCNYILERGCTYWQGYCFDQYLVDWISMRGGWQMPYYASEDNALVPKREGSGLVILPHNTWDWRASFEHNHEFNTHILNAIGVFSYNYTTTLTYLDQLLNRTLNSITPFGYVTIQHEWLWVRQSGRLNELENYTLTVMNSPYLFQTFNETAEWFKQHYASNPSYYVNFITPYDEKKVEWLWTRNFRVTRYDEQYVVGYLDYTAQNIDPYINATAGCDFLGEKNETNSICTSLALLIDDFGNATARAPPKGNRMTFSEALEDFPLYFVCAHDDAPPTINSPIQQPSSDAVLPDQPVKILVSIVDLESGVKNATLYFNLNNSTEWRLVQMSYNQSSGFYEAFIPAQPEGTYVKYEIVAYDYADNTVEQNKTGQCYICSVPSESLPISTLLLLMFFLIILAFCQRKYLKRMFQKVFQYTWD